MLVRRVVEARKAHYSRSFPIGQPSTKPAATLSAEKGDGQVKASKETGSGGFLSKIFKRTDKESPEGPEPPGGQENTSIWKRLCCF